MPIRAEDKFMEWARCSFRTEVSNGFAQAKQFDGYMSQVLLRPLLALPPPTLDSLARVLPMGLASTHPTIERLRDQLPTVEKQAIEDYQRAVQQLREAEWDRFSEHVVRMRKRDTLTEAKRIRKVGLAVIEEVADEWQYLAEKITPTIWSLRSTRPWGKLSVQFDLESTLELQYAIFVYDSSGVQLRGNDHYLGVLGIGGSAWCLEPLERCQDKVRSACKFVRWHLAEYERLMAS
jgi:hypothetical protein